MRSRNRARPPVVLPPPRPTIAAISLASSSTNARCSGKHSATIRRSMSSSRPRPRTRAMRSGVATMRARRAAISLVGLATGGVAGLPVGDLVLRDAAGADLAVSVAAIGVRDHVEGAEPRAPRDLVAAAIVGARLDRGALANPQRQ